MSAPQPTIRSASRPFTRAALGILLTGSWVLALLFAALWARSYRYGDLASYRRSSLIDGRWQCRSIVAATGDGVICLNVERYAFDSEREKVAFETVTRHNAPPGQAQLTWKGQPHDGLARVDLGATFWGRRGFRWQSLPLPLRRVPASGVRCQSPLWFPTVVFAAAPSLWAVHRFVRWRRATRRGIRGQCPSCGYDLRATPGRCPECGSITSGGQSRAPAWRFRQPLLRCAAIILPALMMTAFAATQWPGNNPPASSHAPPDDAVRIAASPAAPSPNASGPFDAPAPDASGDPLVFLVGVRAVPGVGGSTPVVQVLRPHAGRWHSAIFTPVPGDLIGGTVDGVDMTTPYTLVTCADISGGEFHRATLVDGDGHTQLRTVRSDWRDPTRQALEQRAVWLGKRRTPAEIRVESPRNRSPLMNR